MTSNRIKQYSRELRNNSTLSEVLLWKRIKNRQVRGYKFLRQKPTGRYIMDFYCHKLRLDIEIDGCSHYENEAYDRHREDELKKQGITILHIPDSMVKRNIEGVIFMIEDWIDRHGSENPPPRRSRTTGHPL